jgi:hypothetical protein
MFIHHASRELNVRIVYCGPPGSGASENLRVIHARLAPETRSELVTAESENRTMVFFDFLPEGLGKVRGYTIRLHLYALDTERDTADDCDLSTFQDVDGVVYVVDPRAERFEANIAGVERIATTLAQRQNDWRSTPAVFQLLHRAAEHERDHDALRAAMAPGERPWLEAAADGTGMFDTLKAILRATLIAMGRGQLREWVDPQG